MFRHSPKNAFSLFLILIAVLAVVVVIFCVVRAYWEKKDSSSQDKSGLSSQEVLTTRETIEQELQKPTEPQSESEQGQEQEGKNVEEETKSIEDTLAEPMKENPKDEESMEKDKILQLLNEPEKAQ